MAAFWPITVLVLGLALPAMLHGCGGDGTPTPSPTPHRPTASPTSPPPTAPPTPSPPQAPPTPPPPTAPPTPPPPTPPPAPVGPRCQKIRFPEVKNQLEKRYNNENQNEPSAPSYVKNGLMVHTFECSMSGASIDCMGIAYNLNDPVQWNPECGAASTTSPQESIFCPLSGDWKIGKQASSFTYLRNDLLAQSIYSFGGNYVDVGYIIGDNAFASISPRCGWGGDANTNARGGGGCGAFNAQPKPTLEDPASMYSASCQTTIFKGKNKSQWAQAYQSVHGMCSIVFNNDAGAGSTDQSVQDFRNALNAETKNPFDDMFVANTACPQGHCPTGAVGCNEVLLPCCNSIEVSQPDSRAKNKNFPSLADLDILAIFYVVRPNSALPLDQKMKAAKFVSEQLAKATNTDPVIVVGIDQDALNQHRFYDVFTCDDTAQASTGYVKSNAEILI